MSVCARCQKPLDQWGEHLTSCSARLRKAVRYDQTPTNKATPQRIVPPAPRLLAPRKRLMSPKPPDTSRYAQMLALVSTDRSHPTSAADIATALCFEPRLAGIALCTAAKKGHVRRVSFGRYIRV